MKQQPDVEEISTENEAKLEESPLIEKHSEQKGQEPQEIQSPPASGGLFGALALLGPILPLVCAAAMFIPGIREWGHQSAPIMQLFAANSDSGNRLFVFGPDGTPFPDVSPFCLWFLDGAKWLWETLGISQLTGLPLSDPILAGTATALAAGLTVLVVWCSGLVMGGSAKAALASCAIFLSLPYSYITFRTDLPNTLFTMLLLGSLLFLYGGYSRPKAPVRLLLGYILAAFAAFTGGAGGMFLPLLVSFFFLFWRGTFRRAGALDGALGFGAMLALLCGWLTWLALDVNGHAIIASLTAYHLKEWTQAWDNGYFAQLGCLGACAALPWLALFLFLPWERAVSIPGICWRNRRENPAAGWLWLAILSAAVLLLFNQNMLLPLLALLSIAAGHAILRLSPLRKKLLFVLLGLLFILAAILLGAAYALPLVHQHFSLELLREIPSPLVFLIGLPGLEYFTGICLATGLLLILLGKSRTTAGTCLFCFLLSIAALSVPFNLITLPALAAEPGTLGTEKLPPLPEAPTAAPAVQTAPLQEPSSSTPLFPETPSETPVPTPSSTQEQTNQ